MNCYARQLKPPYSRFTPITSKYTYVVDLLLEKGCERGSQKSSMAIKIENSLEYLNCFVCYLRFTTSEK